MAKVRVRLAPQIGAAPVELTINATVSELQDYIDNNRGPSHAVAHRLSEAIHEALSRLRASVEIDVLVDR